MNDTILIHPTAVIAGSAEIASSARVGAFAIIGENVRIGGLQFQVVGVLESKGQAGGFGNNPDDIVVIPLSTGRSRLMGTPDLNNIQVLTAGTNFDQEKSREGQAIPSRVVTLLVTMFRKSPAHETARASD